MKMKKTTNPILVSGDAQVSIPCGSHCGQGAADNTVIQCTVHSVFFPKLCLISGLIELKFSGKTPNEVLYAPIYFWGVYF